MKRGKQDDKKNQTRVMQDIDAYAQHLKRGKAKHENNFELIVCELWIPPRQGKNKPTSQQAEAVFDKI